jgi:lysophospholipase L1-like esterase
MLEQHFTRSCARLLRAVALGLVLACAPAFAQQPQTTGRAPRRANPPASAPAQRQSGEPKHHAAVTPVPQSWWLARLLQTNERVAQGNVDLVFLGDSITQGWETAGKDVWEKCYGDRKALNLGFSGDRTQHVLWRLDHGNIDGIRPKVVVLMIGTNNSNDDDNTAEEIADGIIAIVRELRQKLPDTKVLLLAIFPRGAGPSPQREKNAEASRLASTIADGRMVYYLDIGDHFLVPDGTLSQEIMPDLLHLSPAGYEIWAESIEPKLAELLGETLRTVPSEERHAAPTP